jgi:hypothetical protein
LTSYQPAPIETVLGCDVKSLPARAGLWKSAQAMPMAVPFAARANGTGRPIESLSVAGPEKRGSK